LQNDADQIYYEGVQRRVIQRIAKAVCRRKNARLSDSIQAARDHEAKKSLFKFWRKKRTELRAGRWRAAVEAKTRALQDAHDERIMRNRFAVSRSIQSCS